MFVFVLIEVAEPIKSEDGDLSRILTPKLGTFNVMH